MSLLPCVDTINRKKKKSTKIMFYHKCFRTNKSAEIWHNELQMMYFCALFSLQHEHRNSADFLDEINTNITLTFLQQSPHILCTPN